MSYYCFNLLCRCPISYHQAPCGPGNKVRGASAGESFDGGDCFSKKNLAPAVFFFFLFEDVYRFPGSGSVMDSNAAKEIIHSCPITTYEAPINTRSPGLGGRPGELLLNMLCLGEVVVVGGFTFCLTVWRPSI